MKQKAISLRKKNYLCTGEKNQGLLVEYRCNQCDVGQMTGEQKQSPMGRTSKSIKINGWYISKYSRFLDNVFTFLQLAGG
jgi:hypothetical protein